MCGVISVARQQPVLFLPGNNKQVLCSAFSSMCCHQSWPHCNACCMLHVCRGIHQQQGWPVPYPSTPQHPLHVLQVPLGHALVSLLWLPQGAAWLRPCTARILSVLMHAVGRVLSAAHAGRLHISPGLMEEVQDAIGTTYSLLTIHGRWASRRITPSEQKQLPMHECVAG